MFLNPTQPLLHVKVLAVSWTVTVHGPMDRALLKFISLLSCLGSLGCGSEANATKDLVDALDVCFLSCVARAEANRVFRQGGPGGAGLTPPYGARNECNSFMNLRLSKTTR